MRGDAVLAVLRELGVLFEAPGGSNQESEPADGQARDHLFHDHGPLWNHEHPRFARPFSDARATPLFLSLRGGTGVQEAMAHTRLLVFLGAADTPALRRVLAEPGALALVFDRDPGRVVGMAQALGPAKLAGRAHVFLGDPDEFLPPLGMTLPADLFRVGFPVFFALPELERAQPGYVRRCVGLLELLYYRHAIYPVSGQGHCCGLPIRPMARGLFYDQQLHACQNAADMALAPDIGLLRRAFQGETAILVAAGPELPERMDYLKAQRGKGLIIAVNNALKPLLAGGVRPHMVVINDTSVATAPSWEGLPAMPDIVLAGHCLSNLGGGRFPTRFLFGSFRQEVFGPRPGLRLHGSVITTAYSLARHLGCTRCVLVGAQLCSPDPWSLSYSRGSIHERQAPPPRPLTGAFPQLVPVDSPFGLTLYTSLNFLDAARWLLDEIRSTGLACVNLTKASLLHGPGVQYDPDYDIPATDSLDRRLRQVHRLRPRPRPLGPVRQALEAERRSWQAIAEACARIGQGSGPALAAAGMEILAQFDANNVSYLVQRFPGFDHGRFHADVFEGGDRERGLRLYLEHVGRMAGVLARSLGGQLEILAGAGR